MSFYNRKKYSVFNLTLTKNGKKTKMQQALSLLKEIYPYEINEQKIKICKNKDQYCVLVFNEENCSENLSTLFVMQKCKNFTGKVRFVGEDFVEELEFLRGKVLKNWAEEKFDVVDKIFVSEAKKGDYVNEKSKIVFYKSDVNFRTMKILKQFFAGLLIFVVAACFIGIQNANSKKENNERQILLLQEKQLKQEQEKLKNLERECEALEKEYSKLYYSFSLSPYHILSEIYRCIVAETNVIFLTIDKNNFSVELNGKQPIKVLENFEKNKSFENCTLERSSIENELQSNHFKISARAVQVPLQCDKNSSLEIKKEFFTKQIALLNEKTNKNANKNFADCAEAIEKKVKKSACVTQYVQSLKNDSIVNFETQIQGSAKGILTFIKEIVDDWNVVSVRVNNSTNSKNIIATFKIETNIQINKSNEKSFQTSAQESPIKMAKIFNLPVKKNIVQSVALKNPVKKNDEKINRVNYFSIIGRAKELNGNNTILMKNTRSNEIFKVLEFDEDSSRVCFKYENQKYEVLK